MNKHQNRPQQAAVPAGDSPPKRPRRGALNGTLRWLDRRHDLTIMFWGIVLGVLITIAVHILGAYWPWVLPR